MITRPKIALTIALALAVNAPARADESRPQTVPFELLKTQHMVVNIKINGKGPFRVIFDTGAPVNLINNKIAREAGVLPKDFKAPIFALFGNMGQFKMKTLEIGNVKAENVSTMVMDHPTVAAISNVLGPIEGIVGFSFFARYRMTIDYQAKEMTFVPVAFEPPDMIDHLTKMIRSATQPKQKILVPGGLVGLRVSKAADDKPGVVVQEVFPGSPAAVAGVLAGDRLLTLDSRWTDTVIDTYEAASKLQAGTDAVLVVERDGKEKTFTLKVRAGQ